MSIGNVYGTGVSGYYHTYIGNSTVKKNDDASRTEGTAGEAADASSVSDGHAVKTDGAAEKASILKQLTGGISGKLTVQQSKYGQSIGDVSLSDKAADYYESLKKRYGNMNFVLVSDDVKNAVQSNAAAYAGTGKTTVLINVDKVEKMASDSSYRQKYESILTNAQSQLSGIASAAQQKSGGDSILASFGMSVNENGDTSWFAVFRKQQKDISTSLSSRRAEKAAEKKKAEKAQAKKDAAEKAQEKISDKKAAEKAADAAKADKLREAKTGEKTAAEKAAGEETDFDADDYDVLTSSTSEGLIEKIRDYLASGSENTEGAHFSAEA